MSFEFSYQNPTRIHFGENALENLPFELSIFGEKVLLVYGTGSIKRTGIYDTVMECLLKAGKTVKELSDVTSNPTASKVYEGIALSNSFQPDLILAVGGGSVIDCAKAIAVGACTTKDFWDTFFVKRESPEDALPVGVVLTMAGTGSEMNGGAVITNELEKKKYSTQHGYMYPVFSILNPKYTYSVPQEQMVSGICDIISHLMETYCSPSDDDIITDALIEAILKNTLSSARIAVKDPYNYTARSNLMWGAMLALNGILDFGKMEDWMAHQIEHQIGAFTACPHGLGLSAISANYYRRVLPYAPNRFARFATNVFGISSEGKTETQLGYEGIDALESFFKEIGAATTLSELGLTTESPLREMANSCRRLQGGYRKWTKDEIYALLLESL